MSKRAELLDRLAHDVGKYVARVAHNVDASRPLAPEVRAMLCDDLYATKDGRRASELFEELAGGLPASTRRAEHIEAARRALARIDVLEVAVRRGDRAAVSEVLGAALEVERCLVASRGAR